MRNGEGIDESLMMTCLPSAKMAGQTQDGFCGGSLAGSYHGWSRSFLSVANGLLRNLAILENGAGRVRFQVGRMISDKYS